MPHKDPVARRRYNKRYYKANKRSIQARHAGYYKAGMSWKQRNREVVKLYHTLGLRAADARKWLVEQGRHTKQDRPVVRQ